ncbi:MAG: hypothetical protein HY965_03925, partial [Ignavibacteriales bacterium]|nr:hypothetical protein [Ignavibacteriales bacterium]
MKKLLFLITVLNTVLIFSQSIPVTFIYNPTTVNYNTVRISGSFNGWTTNNASYVMSY